MLMASACVDLRITCQSTVTAQSQHSHRVATARPEHGNSIETAQNSTDLGRGRIAGARTEDMIAQDRIASTTYQHPMRMWTK